MVKKYLLSKADVDELERQLDDILGMVGKYCQPEVGRAVREIRELLNRRLNPSEKKTETESRFSEEMNITRTDGSALRGLFELSS